MPKYKIPKKSVADFPELLAEWHPVKNGELKPSGLSYGSHIMVWWKCHVADDHEWQATPNSRTNKKSSCPCCSGHKVVLSNCLATTHPDLVKQWHPTRNCGLTPYDISFGSTLKVWWKCALVDDHEWQAPPNNRTNGKTGCPCCSGDVVVRSNCLVVTHPEVASTWHPTKNGDLTPYDVGFGSSTHKVWWKCPVADDHEWQQTPNARTNGCSGRGCPCCHGTKVVKSNCLATTHPHLAKEWHPTLNRGITPYDVTYGNSTQHVWWQASCGHPPWRATVNGRTNGASGCPVCDASKGELLVAAILEKMQLHFKREVSFGTCRHKKPLPFDFLVRISSQKGFLIEYQGHHHYQLVRWHKTMSDERMNKQLEIVRKRDQIKLNWAKSHRIPLLVIPYWEREKVEELIKEFIENLSCAKTHT